MIDMNAINKAIKTTIKEVLKENISTTREELDFSLTPKDLEELLPHGKTKINEMLRKYDYDNPNIPITEKIPNKKIGGKRVIPREWFLAWYYGQDLEDGINEEKVKISNSNESNDMKIPV